MRALCPLTGISFCAEHAQADGMARGPLQPQMAVPGSQLQSIFWTLALLLQPKTLFPHGQWCEMASVTHQLQHDAAWLGLQGGEHHLC